MLGKITRLTVTRGFGFIKVDDCRESDHFFHASQLRDLPFDERLLGQAVEFESSLGEKGLNALEIFAVKE